MHTSETLPLKNLFPSFETTLKKGGLKLERTEIETVQINLGKLCNQACHHCHVEAGPKHKENMELKAFEQIIKLIERTPSIKTLDLTGGAPELNPHFRWLVERATQLGKKVIDRCNLTVLFEPGQETTAQFLREHQVEVVASLPCYTKENVDKQRGNGVFDLSIRGLQLLNGLGYGRAGSSLTLNLVYNPGGAFLPPDQTELEVDYKAELLELFGIEFNHLFTITNMPIKRFLKDLARQNAIQSYMDLLLKSFNPTSVNGLMCRSLISVGYDGKLFDCDFNQMLEIPVAWKPKTLWDLENFNQITSLPIATAAHCYGCTAGSGSSCGGSLI